MKFSLLSVALGALLFSNAADAQLGVAKKVLPKVTVGAKAGLNMQQVSGDYVENAFGAGIVGGVFVGVSKKKMGVRVEGLVKSAKISYATGGSYIKTVGLDIPVLFQYSPVQRLKLHIGPQFSMLLSAKDNADTDVKSLLNSSDIAAAVGADVYLPFKLTVGARYIKGFSNLNNTSIPGSGDWTTSTIQVTVGYRFLN